MTTRHRAIMITPAFTAVDRRFNAPDQGVTATDPETWSRGLGWVLDRWARHFGNAAPGHYDRNGEGVVLLDAAAAHALKLPAGPEEATTVGLDDARAAGWLHGKVHAWTPFYAEGRPRVIVGIMSWPEFDRSPLAAGDPVHPVRTLFRVSAWHELVGSAWHGFPSVVGAELMKRTAPKWKVRGKDVGPSWGYPAGPPAGEAYEYDYDPEDWSRPQTLKFAHGYDFTRMYLAAAQGCERLAPWSLRHSGRIAFTPSLAGWWQVELGPWNFPNLPAPAGPGTTPDATGKKAIRWVTTPTLELLTQLREAGEEFQDFEVLDSWTGNAKRVLRTWGETLEGAYQKARTRAGDQEEPADEWERDARGVMKAVKTAYRESWGLLNHVTETDGAPDEKNRNATFRPDWHYAILAQARANLWRRLWLVGKSEGRWPVVIEVDNAWYESDQEDPEKAKPAGIPLETKAGDRDRLGTFKVKGTRTKGSAR